MAVAGRSGHVLWTSVILLSGLVACVRCEMKKSWKVSATSGGNGNSLQSLIAPEPGELEHVLAKQPRFESVPTAPEDEHVQQNTVEPEIEKIDQQTAAPAAVTSSSSSAQPRSRLRSTYVANRTSAVYSSVRESAKAAPFLEDHEPEIQIDDFSADEADEEEDGLELNDHQKRKKNLSSEDDKYAEGYDMIEAILDEVKSLSGEREPSQKDESIDPSKPDEIRRYDFGPVLNMTIDESNNIVRVKLNEQVLKDIFTGRRSGGGGGGNKKMWKYAMPLFILPFLIQSAIIPFLLTTVKLFLLKSFLAGKMAIFLLLLGAFKNFTQKKEKEVYVKDLPDRRYESYSEWPYPYQSEGRPNWSSN